MNDLAKTTFKFGGLVLLSATLYGCSGNASTTYGNNLSSAYAVQKPVSKRVSKPSTKTLKRASTRKVAFAAQSSTAPKTRKKRYLGKASYICSPSGFGRKSTCFARNG